MTSNITRDQKRKDYWESIKKLDGNRIKGIKQTNSEIILQLLHDFEDGINTPVSKKGVRSAGTLLKFRHQFIFVDKKTKTNFTNTKEFKRAVHRLIKDMLDKKLLKKSGKPYTGINEFIKNLKTLDEWLIRTKRTKKRFSEDLSFLDTEKKRKPAWVFLTEQQRKDLCDQSKGVYRPLIVFILDCGIRPEELYRIVVSDFEEDFTVLNIPAYRDDGTKVSKTIERKIKLLRSSELIKAYVKFYDLKPNDLLVQMKLETFNKYLRILGKKLFGTEPTKARGSPDKLKLYDLRHNSVIMNRNLYPTNRELMYRFGWLKEDKIFYYDEFLDMKDKPQQENLYTQEDKRILEKEIDKLKETLKEIQNKNIISDDILNKKIEELVKFYLLKELHKKSI